MDNLLMGLGLSSSTGYKPFIPLLVISIASRLGFIELVQHEEWLGSFLFIGILILLSILDLLSTSIPFIGRLFDILGVPVTLVCGYLAITSLVGNTAESNAIMTNLIGIFVGSGSAGVVKTSSIVTNLLSDTVTLGVSGPLNSIKDSLKAFFVSVVAIVAPIIVCFLLVLFAFMTYKGLKKLKELRKRKNLSTS
ncbi:MAG: DUF4126 domain-containing protein [Tissierellales bacterium]